MAPKRPDYNQLDKSPYNSFLQRTDDLNYGLGDNLPTGGNQATSPAPQKDENGSVEKVALKSDGGATDIWIKNFIRSTEWKPKTVGFYINGQTGYAEFSNIFVSGTIEASAGSLGGFVIGPDYIRDFSNTMGLASTVTGGDDVRFWAGETFANRASAPFYVTESGLLVATNVQISGGIVSSDLLDGVISQLNLSIANQSWGQSCTFTPIDFNTVNWGTGTISFSDGNDYSIVSGTTGNMATAKVYVYFDLDASTTVYQQTANISDTTGANKVVIAVVTRGTAPAKATYQLFGGGGGIVVDGGSVTPGSITYTELAYPPLVGAGVPTITPGNFGQIYIDGLTQDAYLSTGSSTPYDWRKITLAAYVSSLSFSVFDTVTITENRTLVRI